MSCSASGMDTGKIEEMEKMLKEAHAEKSRLMESRVSKCILGSRLGAESTDWVPELPGP